MSSGLATFFRPDGTIAGYGIYYGTADILLGLVAGTPEGAWEARAKGDPYPDCTCGQPPEPVVILSEYGGEWWWHGEWCPRCRCITGPCAPDVCQVCHESPYYSERHECVRIETHEGRPSFPVR
ncbi:MAG TPA: hypothetical protein VMG58_17090 [Candidatus Sulfotelmatobacter sp.]|nr:hypothetical protein [Candidatus Sulfotelmatobacter sp.]